MYNDGERMIAEIFDTKMLNLQAENKKLKKIITRAKNSLIAKFDNDIELVALEILNEA